MCCRFAGDTIPCRAGCGSVYTATITGWNCVNGRCDNGLRPQLKDLTPVAGRVYLLGCDGLYRSLAKIAGRNALDAR
jgi:hypothetical protein